MMLHLLLKCAPSFTVGFVLLNIIARSMGAGQPGNPVLAGFVEGCRGRPQPCWYGIVLEQTSRREVVRLTRAQGYAVQSEINSGSIRVFSNYTPPSDTQGCNFGVAFDLNGAVVDYRLRDCQGLYLGDVIQQYGLEGAVAFGKDAQGTLEYTFPDIAYKIVFSFTGSLRPLNSVDDMEIYPVVVRLASIFAWHGFAPQRRYCQFEPLNVACS